MKGHQKSIMCCVHELNHNCCWRELWYYKAINVQFSRW